MSDTAERPERPFSGGYWEERNRRRREAYAADPELRERLRDDARQGYHDRNSGGNRAPAAQARIDYLEGVDLTAFGEVRVLSNGKEVHSFRIDEAADALSITPKQLNKWMVDGRAPQPLLRALVSGKVPVPVFTLEEMQVIVSALYDHAHVFAYYRVDHTETRERIHSGIAAVREGYLV